MEDPMMCLGANLELIWRETQAPLVPIEMQNRVIQVFSLAALR